MASKVNLKKYLAHEGKWQFFPVLKMGGRPRPDAVLINGEPVKGTSGKFYLDYRQEGKRVQRLCGTTPRDALDAWRKQHHILDGTIEAYDEEEPLPLTHVSVVSAQRLRPSSNRSSPPRLPVLSRVPLGLEWFLEHVRVQTVAKVTPVEIIRLLGRGRELGLVRRVSIAA